METTKCDACGERFRSGNPTCPSCGAANGRASKETEEGDGDDIASAADDLRGDRWKTFIVLVGGGLVISGVLVGSIFMQLFSGSDGLPASGPAYPDTKAGARAFLGDEVLPQLEMKYSTESNPSFTCDPKKEVQSRSSGEYGTTVECRSSEKMLTIRVAVTHGEKSMTWDSHIEASEAK